MVEINAYRVFYGRKVLRVMLWIEFQLIGLFMNLNGIVGQIKGGIYFNCIFSYVNVIYNFTAYIHKYLSRVSAGVYGVSTIDPHRSMRIPSSVTLV